MVIIRRGNTSRRKMGRRTIINLGRKEVFVRERREEEKRRVAGGQRGRGGIEGEVVERSGTQIGKIRRGKAE